jgi:hypothetical protein
MVDAKIWIGAGFVEGEDILDYAGAWNFAYTPSTGFATLTPATPQLTAAFITELEAVYYENAGDAVFNPTPGTREIWYEVYDGEDWGSDMRELEVVAVNDPPVLTLAAAALVDFDEDGPAVVLDPTLTIEDPDSDILTAAEIEILVTDGGELWLDDALADSFGLTYYWSSGDDTLYITGDAAVADYQRVLRTVEFFDTDDDPTDLFSSTIEFRVYDEFSSNDIPPGTAPDITITTNAVNDAPMIAPNPMTGANVFFYAIDEGDTLADFLSLDGYDPESGDTVSYVIVGGAVPEFDIYEANVGQYTELWFSTDAVPTDFETRSSYVFNIYATDGTADSGYTTVIITINDVDESTGTYALLTPIEDQLMSSTTNWGFQVADNFEAADPLLDDSRTFSASMSDGSGLPGWLHFDNVSGTFWYATGYSGTPGVSQYEVEVKAIYTDDITGDTEDEITDTFIIDVWSALDKDLIEALDQLEQTAVADGLPIDGQPLEVQEVQMVMAPADEYPVDFADALALLDMDLLMTTEEQQAA